MAKRVKLPEVLDRYLGKHGNHKGLSIGFLATNLPAEEFSFTQVVNAYNEGWTLEHQFHDLNDRPLGIRTIWVARDDQIVGLTHLITLALRLLTLIGGTIRRTLKTVKATLKGLYEGQRSRVTDRPSPRRILRDFNRAEITLTHVRSPTQDLWHLTALPPLLVEILNYLDLSESIYADLVPAPSQ